MIKVGIVGYGNLGKGALTAVHNAKDMECVGVFTRRNPESVETAFGVKAYSFSQMKDFKGKIDVMLVCGGSATDLPVMTKEILKDFCTVDSFDTHKNIPEYRATLDKTAKENGTLCALSIGWDPGVFSVARMIFGATLPDGKDYTFWGKGVSQGHSDAVRRIEGVLDARQYTVPKEEALERVRKGENPDLSTREKHSRVVYVVAKDGADKTRIEKEIKEMPNYFADYDTEVRFISEEEMKREHSGLAHGGFVLRSGKTSEKNSHLLELSLKLDSNPEFTGSVLCCYGRAVAKLHKEGKTGALTVFDVPLKYLSDKSCDELVETLL